MDLQILQGDCLATLQQLPAESVNCCVTSPPYFGLRDYGVDGQIGLEGSPDEFVAKLVDVFREVRRVLCADGTCWINIGDSYANHGKWGGHTGGKHAKVLHASPIGRNKRYTGLKPKDLIGIPWMVAFALRADGWYLRQDLIWEKLNPMPESVTDRCTKSHEYIFLLSKSQKYFYDQESITEEAKDPGDDLRRISKATLNGKSAPNSERNGIRRAFSFARKTATQGMPGAPAQHRAEREPVEYSGRRNKRSVWTVATYPYPDAHFATYPPDLIKPCILAGCPPGGTVLDPFAGSGTTGKVALEIGRSAILCELNSEYVKLIQKRCRVNLPLMFEEAS